jgi:hypothetical protein
MISAQAPAKSKILTHLKRVAPFSIVERGINLAIQNYVAECSGSGHTITGIVRDDEINTHSVTLTVLSAHEIDATCTCCSTSDMQEQWCHHAVAVLYRAAELDFFDARAGFSERESTFRISPSSPADVALTIREISQLNYSQNNTETTANTGTTTLSPNVSILVDLSSDRLGIRVAFDDQEQEPAIFEGFRSVF